MVENNHIFHLEILKSFNQISCYLSMLDRLNMKRFCNAVVSLCEYRRQIYVTMYDFFGC
jgi:hypothetical protein